MSYLVEYEIRDQLDDTLAAMMNRDDAVPNIRRWDDELYRRWASGLPVEEYMDEIRREFTELSIEKRHWCRAYSDLLSFSHSLGKYGQNWASVAEDLQPDTAEYRQSEIGQFVNRVLNEAVEYYYRWSNDFADELTGWTGGPDAKGLAMANEDHDSDDVATESLYECGVKGAVGNQSATESADEAVEGLSVGVSSNSLYGEEPRP